MKQYGFCMTEKLVARMDEYATESGAPSRADVVRRALDDFLRERGF